MANPIIRGFSKLLQFSGRDTRGEFWPYAGVVIALVMVLGAMAGAVVMARVMADMQPYIVESQTRAPMAPAVPVEPSEVVRVEIVELASPPPMPDFTPFFLIQAVNMVLTVGLLAAAVSRRLHDTDRSAYWGLLPVPFLFGGIVGMLNLMAPVMGGSVPNFGLFGLLFLNNIAYLAALVTLIVLLAQPSSPRANRHGEPRAAAPVRPVEDWSTPG
ncbi:DUF805 domain-containing protein [Brevundimonas sp. FT23042]|uniref:DUF805 domain-containing protein n=1 Tax=Brevundimonas sp. FT23042 TaxID=3393749 RepID=UPI003B58730F